MNLVRRFDNIEVFIAEIKASILEEDKSHQNYFDVYANEARFGLSVIKDDLSNLPSGAEIMEVGAGLMLLSGYLAYKGFRIVALEPISAGFSHFRVLQVAVLRYYEENGIHVNFLESGIEDISDKDRFSYVFSINAFEHIHDINLGLANSYLSLRDGGSLRVYCPNYLFPYEPHFNIPTLINKRLTAFFFKSKIVESKHLFPAIETWVALNWISVTQVRRLFRNRFGNNPMFNSLATYQTIKRALSDTQFRARRTNWIVFLLQVLDRFRLLQLFKLFPVTFSPVMDFKVQRLPDKCNRLRGF